MRYCVTFLLGGLIDAVRTSNLEMVIQLLLKILYSGYICNGDKQKEWFCLQQDCCHSIGKSLCQYHDHHRRSKCLWSHVGRTCPLHLPSKGYRLYKKCSPMGICLQLAIFNYINNYHVTTNDVQWFWVQSFPGRQRIKWRVVHRIGYKTTYAAGRAAQCPLATNMQYTKYEFLSSFCPYCVHTVYILC